MMMSSSEAEPFEGTNSDIDVDFVPSENSEVSSDSETPNLKTHKGKKRISREKFWGRNIRKTKRSQGKPYVSVRGKAVDSKNIGDDCRCRLKCFQRVDAELRRKIFDEFYKLENKDLQDAYLAGHISVRNIARNRSRSENPVKPKSVSLKFKVSYC